MNLYCRFYRMVNCTSFVDVCAQCSGGRHLFSLSLQCTRHFFSRFYTKYTLCDRRLACIFVACQTNSLKCNLSPPFRSKQMGPIRLELNMAQFAALSHMMRVVIWNRYFSCAPQSFSNDRPMVSWAANGRHCLQCVMVNWKSPEEFVNFGINLVSTACSSLFLYAHLCRTSEWIEVEHNGRIGCLLMTFCMYLFDVQLFSRRIHSVGGGALMFSSCQEKSRHTS